MDYYCNGFKSKMYELCTYLYKKHGIGAVNEFMEISSRLSDDEILLWAAYTYVDTMKHFNDLPERLKTTKKFFSRRSLTHDEILNFFSTLLHSSNLDEFI